VRSSEAHGPLLAAFREADAARLDIEAAFPQLVAIRSLNDADDAAAVLHARVHRWIDAARSRRRSTDHLVVGLIPRVRGVTDPDMARALTERENAMKLRARVLVIQAIEEGHAWLNQLGPAPNDPRDRERWLREVSTIAAYRDRWHITGSETLRSWNHAKSTEQVIELERSLSAAVHARTITHEVTEKQMSMVHDIEIQVTPGLGR
jgi:hypothetical protein